MNQVSQGIQSVTQKLLGWLNAIIVSLPNLLLAALILTGFWFLARWAYQLVTTVFKKTDFNRTLEHLLASTVKVMVLAVGLVLALSVLQLDKTVFSMLAGVGVIGLALGFAFQDLASNFISGIMIAVRAPMRVNDVIKIGNVAGTVVDLRLRDTVVRNFDGQDVYVPNKSFMTETFANFSTYGKRKISIAVGLSYHDDVQAACDLLVGEVSKLPIFLKDPKVVVSAESFGDRSVNLNVEGWIKYPGDDPVLAKHQMLATVKSALAKNGFTLANDLQFYEWLGQEVNVRLGADASANGAKRGRRLASLQ